MQFSNPAVMQRSNTNTNFLHEYVYKLLGCINVRKGNREVEKYRPDTGSCVVKPAETYV